MIEERVKIKSSDGIIFLVPLNVAMLSKTLKTLLSNPGIFIESDKKEIFLPIHSKLLKRVFEYMELKFNQDKVGLETKFKVDDYETLDLLEVAAYLKI